MWFPNKTKLNKALTDLLARVENVQNRIEAILSESKMYDSLLGPSLEMEEFRDRGMLLATGLINLQTGLNSNRASVQEINVRVPTAETMVRNHEQTCTAVEKARAASAVAVDQHFKA